MCVTKGFVKTKPFLFSGRIENCYDSHLHWRHTGNFARRLQLKDLKSAEAIMAVTPLRENFQGEWLLGFGWDQNQFPDKAFPTREILDKMFGSTPVYLRRVDGHAAWANTEALKRAGLWQKESIEVSGGKVLRDSSGWPSGILIDNAMQFVQRVLPKATVEDVKNDLRAGQKKFLQAGFTHIRDMTCDSMQWQAACELEESGELKISVEQFFGVETMADFATGFELASLVKRESHKRLRPRGVKVFSDGALGSEGAWISRPYSSGSGCGLQLLQSEDLRKMMLMCGDVGLDIAVHAIGDEAAQIVALTAEKLVDQGLFVKSKSESITLHIEHAELVRPETVGLLRELKVHCHMQPCHWLSDKAWMKDKIGSLMAYAFRWRDLDSAGIPVFFGSDSPVEEIGFQRNLLALQDASENGIPLPLQGGEIYHSHPDKNWSPNTWTEFRDGQVMGVYVQGERIL